MARSQKRGRPQRALDLTNAADPREHIPTERAGIDDVEARFGLTVFGKLINLGLYVRGGARSVGPAVKYLVTTVSATVVAIVFLVICRSVDAPAKVTLPVCLGTFVVTLVVAVATQTRRGGWRGAGANVVAKKASRRTAADEKLKGRRNRKGGSPRARR